MNLGRAAAGVGMVASVLLGGAHAAVVAKTLSFAPDFVLNTGDLVDATDYTQFFSIEQDLLRNAVIMPAPGNHDTASLYQYGFDRPNWYSFRWANAFFISVSTDD